MHNYWVRCSYFEEDIVDDMLLEDYNYLVKQDTMVVVVMDMEVEQDSFVEELVDIHKNYCYYCMDTTLFL
jgi:hypothetical protein